ncbi:hypothetical protein, partial [Nitrosomonas sp. ANs5]|uniref:hypothetical protein n=1 Tax=Nitrosomonas sp. ANs5 TaxID=3423941 RepID=UPI003D331A5E
MNDYTNLGGFPLPKVEGSDLLNSTKWGESLLTEFKKSPDGTLNAIASTHDEISRSWRNLLAIRNSPDPRVTQAAHLDSVAQNYERTQKRLADRITATEEKAQERLRGVEADAKRALGFKD